MYNKTVKFDKIQELIALKYISENINNDKIPLRIFINEMEKIIIKKAMEVSNGNQRKAATILGVGFTTFNEKLKRYRHIDSSFHYNIANQMKSNLNRLFDEFDI